VAVSAIINEGYVGFVDISANGEIAGWLYNPSEELPSQITIVVDGETIHSLCCDARRPDVLANGFARQDCGFHYRLPKELHDNTLHVVKMLAYNGNPLRVRSSDGIEQEEWMIILSAEESIAQIDTWLGRDIHCWALQVDSRNDTKHAPDYVVVRQSGHEVTKLYPTIERPDVAARYDGPLLCGFLLPYKKIQDLTDQSPLQFFVVPGGQEFTGSPLDLTSIPEWSLERRRLIDSENRSVESYRVEVDTDGMDRAKSTEYADQINQLKESGLFDEEYYRSTYSDLAQAEIPLFDHFFSYGYREGRRPNLYFDPDWYRAHASDVQQSDVQPLLHFLIYGDREGRAPSQFFNTSWYRERYRIPPAENTLAHYLRHRFAVPLSPMPDFDADFYAVKNRIQGVSQSGRRV
jgi:hypothetical protein